MSNSKSEYGVIIGRFQTPTLTPGHTYLIDVALAKHKKVIILVGSTPGILVTRRNPLDYYTRMLMIRTAYPLVSILPIDDMPSDEMWSKAVDKRILETTSGNESVTLYGSRDSFIPHYHGRFQTVELPPSKDYSASAVRESLSDEIRNTDDFRLGVLYAAFHRHKCVYPTVDIAVVDRANQRILLGRKASDPQGQYRLPGGFLDPTKDKSYEAAAKRELAEEMGMIEVSNWQFIASAQIDDWRYRSEVDKVFTSLFACDLVFGNPQASDDLDAVHWFYYKRDSISVVMEQHRPLVEMVINKLT